MKDKTYGFTLVELLVVVSIISFLSSIVLANLNSARDKARAANTLQFEQNLKNTFGDTLVQELLFMNGNYSDTSGVGSNMNPSGSILLVPDSKGVANQAVFFSGTSYLSTLPGYEFSSIIQNVDSFSVSLWTKVDITNVSDSIILKLTGLNFWHRMGMWAGMVR